MFCHGCLQDKRGVGWDGTRESTVHMLAPCELAMRNVCQDVEGLDSPTKGRQKMWQKDRDGRELEI